MNSGTNIGDQQSLLEAAWKHRLVVLGITVALAVGGFLFAVLRGEAYSASATVVLEAPIAVSASESGVPVSADRQVANQLEVMRSRAVAERASQLVAASGVDVSTGEIRRNTVLSTIPDSDVIEITFTSESEAIAEVVPQAIIDAYQEVRREQRADEVETVLNQLSATESLLFREFNDVSGRLGEQLEDRALENRMAAVLDELSATQSALSAATDPESTAALLETLDQLDRQLRTLQLALNIELEQPDVANLVSEREDIEVRLAAIQQLRIQIEAESAASGSGLAFLSTPTVEATRGSVYASVSALVGAFLGLFAGLAAAYLLSTSRQSFQRPEEPQGILGVPYLADIPKFEEVGANGPLPVISDPRSPAAESFRFVAASLGFRANRVEAKIIVAVSGSVGEGKSTIIANTALAAARSGKRVLLVDADFGNQAASRLLLGDISLDKGLSELVTGRANLEDVVTQVSAGPDATLDLLSRGTVPTVAPDLFSKPNTALALKRLADMYDLVFIDPPPLLQVAYASNIVEMADASVVIVSHGNRVRSAEDLKARLDLIEAVPLGYVYNRAPLRSDMMESGGSMKDVLGDAGLVEPVKPRSN